MLKDENKYISARETARMLGVQTNTLRMWRWRGSGFYIPYRKNDKGRYEYSLGWVNYLKYNFKKPERGKRPYQLKHATIDNHGLRLDGHKRYCNCIRCVTLRGEKPSVSNRYSVSFSEPARSPSEMPKIVTANKHEELIDDPGYMSRIGKYNQQRKDEKIQKEKVKIEKEKYLKLKQQEQKAVGREQIRTEQNYIRWIHKHEMTPTWRPINEPKKDKNKFSYY